MFQNDMCIIIRPNTLWARIKAFITYMRENMGCIVTYKYDPEAVRAERDMLKDRCSDLTGEISELRDLMQEKANNETKLNLLRLPEVIQGLATNDYALVYDIIAPFLDPHGFKLYHAAQDMTHINPYQYFPAEDNMGYFEQADGQELLHWLEVAAFGNCDWEPVGEKGGYERATNLTINKESSEYRAFRNAISETVVKELLGIAKEVA